MATQLHDMIARLTEETAGVFEAMEWAEDEIAQAARRHPAAADILWHTFGLLVAGDGMGVEFVYRSHARELLERVAAGGDTRPGTAAEVVLVCGAASKVAPFHASAAGLYMRMWAAAFPGHPAYDGQAADIAHYEALRSTEIDDLESMTRRKTAAPERKLGEVTCKGQHNGQPVACRFAAIPSPQPRESMPAAGITERSFEQPSLLDLVAA